MGMSETMRANGVSPTTGRYVNAYVSYGGTTWEHVVLPVTVRQEQQRDDMGDDDYADALRRASVSE